MNKFNERAWAGQIISWIKELITSGKTIFQEATNDEGIKVASGKTKFPDILLFTDKISGLVFNGWELKFPDTRVDDTQMLLNALEKAERLKSNSFVTWNGAEAVIWQITNNIYELKGLHKLKSYPKEKGIISRKELSDNYQKHEPALKKRLSEIIHDLDQLYQTGKLKDAVNISNEIISAITNTSAILIPQFKYQIKEIMGDDESFRQKFNLWKINESSTLKILSTSSKKVEIVEPEEVLAKFNYYRLVGKIVFYQILSENLTGKIDKLELSDSKNIKSQLNNHYVQAQKIDYQAVFENDFTDEIKYNDTIDRYIFELIRVLNNFDFKILPTTVIGNILENLVPKEEKQKFGQYFTPEPLAYFVAFSAIKNRNFVVFDPTSGTGTFLNVFYNILSFLGNKNHQELLNQIWGNDISHFPAILSVINLYKQQVSDVSNFPRVTRKDFFNLQPKQIIRIPDNTDISKINSIEIPVFDAVVSNFPFIQQEDIPKDILTTQLKQEFDKTQESFLDKNNFKINERSDYYIYCFYNALKFLKHNGYLAAITSNAWLGKNYGFQFKKFLLDNFSIKYVIKTNAEHWFKNAQVSTVFITLHRNKNSLPTKFITINFKLDKFFENGDIENNLVKIENFYTQLDYCDKPDNQEWKEDKEFEGVFEKNDKSVRVSIVSNKRLKESLITQENWATFFIAENPISVFENNLIDLHKIIFTTGRGTRTGQDDMHIFNQQKIKDTGIEKDFLKPVLRTSQHLSTILFDKTPDTFLFICDKREEDLKKDYPNAYKWIKKWESETNKKGEPLPKVFAKRKLFWYTLSPEMPASIFISMNPDKKLFFSYSKEPIHLNQRLVAIRPKNNLETPLIAALLNSVVSLIILELNGVSRNLGALDLNADFFKTKMRILNPNLLGESAKQEIINKFTALSKRPIEGYLTEFTKNDRIEFDKSILKAFGYDTKLINLLYKMLIETIDNRINLKNK